MFWGLVIVLLICLAQSLLEALPFAGLFGLALLHCGEESLGDLTGYFGEIYHNDFVRKLPEYVFPLIALVVQGYVILHWLETGDGRWAAVYAGLCLGDVAFSHVLPAAIVPLFNPGIFTSFALGIAGVCVATKHLEDWPWMLLGAGFFVLTPVLLKATGHLFRKGWVHS